MKFAWHEPVKGWGFHKYIPMIDQDRCLVCSISGFDYRNGKVITTETDNPPE